VQFEFDFTGEESAAPPLVAAGLPGLLTGRFWQRAATPPAERRALGGRGRAFVLANHTYAVLARRFIEAVS
jgi:hypothetical protein